MAIFNRFALRDAVKVALGGFAAGRLLLGDLAKTEQAC